MERAVINYLAMVQRLEDVMGTIHSFILRNLLYVLVDFDGNEGD